MSVEAVSGIDTAAVVVARTAQTSTCGGCYMTTTNVHADVMLDKFSDDDVILPILFLP